MMILAYKGMLFCNWLAWSRLRQKKAIFCQTACQLTSYAFLYFFSPCVVFLKRSPRLLSEKTDLPAALGSFFDPAPLQQDSMLKYKPSGLPPELSGSLGLQPHWDAAWTLFPKPSHSTQAQSPCLATTPSRAIGL